MVRGTVAAGQNDDAPLITGDSQTQSAGSMPVTRSTTKAQVNDPGLICCLDLSMPPVPRCAPDPRQIPSPRPWSAAPLAVGCRRSYGAGGEEGGHDLPIRDLRPLV